jgi:organic radical activating enzyme
MNNDLFQPGLNKLIHHQEHLLKIEKGKIVSPIHISVWPTNRCQLRCRYCCFKKTTRTNEELDIKDFKNAIYMLSKYDLKAVEFSGGGESLLWTHFEEAVDYVYSLGLDLSLVTNGLELHKQKQETLSKFNWIRVSIQSAEYAKEISFDYIPNNVRKSMSYIAWDINDFGEIEKVYKFANENNIIIRVAPNRPCTEEWALQIGNEVIRLGYPLLFFDKEQGSAEGCYFAWLRGAIDWRGMYLPCPSIELSPESAGKIPKDFAVCHISEIENWLINNPPHDMGYRCGHCNCGKSVNNFIHNLLQPLEDINFV